MPIYSLQGVEVQFPYEAYPCQLDYMSRVITALQEKKNALLESPTGTGKTLCLLCATLAWRESLKQDIKSKKEELQANPHSSTIVQSLREDYAEYKAEQRQLSKTLPTIIYASRTHSQIKQVMNELAMTSYNPTTAVLGSRQQGCLNPSVQSLPAAALNQACKALTANRQCPWHNNTDRFLRNNEAINTQIMDIEDIIKVGTQKKVCPYYLCRSMSMSADVVFMPYNYLIDQNTRGGLSISWDNAVLIFDEAHNVEHVCSDAASFDIPAAVIAGAIEEAGTAAELAYARCENGPRIADEFGNNGNTISYQQLGHELRSLQLVLQKLEEEIANIKFNPKDGFTAPGSFLFQLLSKIKLTSATWLEMSRMLDQATSMLTDEAINGGRISGARTTFYRMHALREALSLAFSTHTDDNDDNNTSRTNTTTNNSNNTITIKAAGHHAYRVHIHMESKNNQPPTPTLSYWCFSPGLSMKAIAALGVRSIILTSGTLSPLSSFAQELTIPFDIRLENSHVIDPSQVWIGILCRGPQQATLSSSYHNRNAVGYKDDLGNAIVNFARIVPDGLLVFFPSYSLLKDSIEAWKAPGIGGSSIWERIVQYKAPVIEPREAGMFPAAAADFRAKLDNPAYKGAAFFAVCRGKASEGLDFSDRAGRAVIVTGIPYATKIDPKVQIKQSVLNENLRQRQFEKERRKRMKPSYPYPHNNNNSDYYNNNNNNNTNDDDDDPLSGDVWYVQQAMRAVNQAMGRVIRHKRDYGAIILCDERFKGEAVRKQMSRWLRDKVQVFDKYGNASSSLTRFFKEQAEKSEKGQFGGQRTVPSDIQVNNTSKLEKTTFQIATKNNNTANHSSLSRNNNNNQQSLVQSAPAAMDMAGIADLIGNTTSIATKPPPTQDNTTTNRTTKNRTTITTGGGGGGIDDVLASSPMSNNHHHRPDVFTLKAPNLWERPSSLSNSRLGISSSQNKLVLPPTTTTTTTTVGGGKQSNKNAALSLLQSKMNKPLAGVNNAVGPAHVLQRHQEKKEQKQVSGMSMATTTNTMTTSKGGGDGGTNNGGNININDNTNTTIDDDDDDETINGGGGDVIDKQHDDDGDEEVQQKKESTSTKQPSHQSKKTTTTTNIQFLDKLKLELPQHSSQKIFDALHLYKKTKDSVPLIEVAAAELYTEEQRSLRIEFRKFLPRAAQSRFDTRVAQLAGMKDASRIGRSATVAAARSNGASGGGGSVVNEVLKQRHAAETHSKYHRDGWGAFEVTTNGNRAASTTARNGMASTSTTATMKRQSAPPSSAGNQRLTASCSECKKSPMDAPHEAKCCQRVACYGCFIKLLAGSSTCTLCNKPLRKNMIVKKFFV